MPRMLLALLLALTSAPASAADAALGALLNARSAAGPAFDGSRIGVPVSDPVRADGEPERGTPTLERAPGADAPAAAPRPTQTVAPTPARGISGGYIGLYPESDFELGTGRCPSCRGPREGKWYFLDEVIATPKTGPEAIVWIGSKEMVEGAVLSEDGKTVTLEDGSVIPFSLTPRISTNRSYWNPDSLKHLRGRRLRIRGEFVEEDGVRTLVARTVWPEDYRLDLSGKATGDAATASDIDALVASDGGGASEPFETKLLWAKNPDQAVVGKPVMGFMLNGAQGDDDESLGGHFSMFTGRVGPGGSMSDWMFDNFYSMDSHSEKGIVASMVPMDKYMMDLNSGQSWYRPTYMLVMVMRDDRTPLRFQERFKKAYADYYAQRVKYHKTYNPCTALIVDPVRGEGWRFPETGKTPSLVARAIAGLAGLGSGDPETSKELYEVLRQEGTHLYPRAAFNSLGGDVLTMAGAYGAEPAGREYNELEKAIQEDLEAVYWVRLPQVPSSRAMGRDPAGGFLDYFGRVPLDRSKWQTVPTAPRSFPPPGALP